MATAKNRKPAIEKAQGIDDIVKPIAKALKKVVKQKSVPAKNTTKQLKKASKYNAASRKRAQEYDVARQAEKDVKYQERNYGMPFVDKTKKDYVRKFVKMDPKKVKSGKR